MPSFIMRINMYSDSDQKRILERDKNRMQVNVELFLRIDLYQI